MDEKKLIFQNATQKLASRKITLYHLIAPINATDFERIKAAQSFNMSKNALGGQSDGYYFFTTRKGLDNHINTMRDTWDTSDNKHAYIVESNVILYDVKYPKWKLDYESMQDFLFDMIYNAALRKPININGIKAEALDNKRLSILHDGKFSKIKKFTPSIHSGLVETISDYLYKSDKIFQNEYDKLLMDVFMGNGEDIELYAVKTTDAPIITNITKIENQTTIPQTIQNSQISKFMARYGRHK